MAILIDVFPTTFGDGIGFMHDPDVGVLLILRHPPVPAETMGRAKSERVQVFDIFPVGDIHQSIAARRSHWHSNHFSENYHLISYKAAPKCVLILTAPSLTVRFSILPHIPNVVTHILETWGKKTHGAIND